MLQEVDRQREAVEETGASIERMSVSIADVNSNVETVEKTARHTVTSVGHMHTSITEVGHNMDQLSGTIDGASASVVEMTTAIREIARSAETLRGETDSTKISLRGLEKSVGQVEENAQRSHELSSRAAEQAERGMRDVEETVQGMREIEVSFQSLHEITDRLAERSQSIGDVVNVIEEVVGKTSLLALNASIIAASAGEHGRSFHVVAEGVKNLAERTASSTHEIAALIKSVQGEVGQCVEAMGVGAERVNRGVALSSRAGETLDAIRKTAHASAGAVDEIVDAYR